MCRAGDASMVSVVCRVCFGAPYAAKHHFRGIFPICSFRKSCSGARQALKQTIQTFQTTMEIARAKGIEAGKSLTQRLPANPVRLAEEERVARSGAHRGRPWALAQEYGALGADCARYVVGVGGVSGADSHPSLRFAILVVATPKQGATAMNDQEWKNLTPDEKTDQLRRELRDFLDQERDNMEKRNRRHEQLVQRVDELEKALKRMESQSLRS